MYIYTRDSAANSLSISQHVRFVGTRVNDSHKVCSTALFDHFFALLLGNYMYDLRRVESSLLISLALLIHCNNIFCINPLTFCREDMRTVKPDRILKALLRIGHRFKFIDSHANNVWLVTENIPPLHHVCKTYDAVLCCCKLGHEEGNASGITQSDKQDIPPKAKNLALNFTSKCEASPQCLRS